MVRKEARGVTPRGTNWKGRIALAISGVAILSVCLGLRQFSGPQDAKAQAPREAESRCGPSQPGHHRDRASRPTTRLRNR